MNIVYFDKTGKCLLVYQPNIDFKDPEAVKQATDSAAPSVPHKSVILPASALPKAGSQDWRYLSAWRVVDKKVVVDLKAFREMAHEERRKLRDAEFSPFDAIIARQIPGDAAKQAEVNREKIRKKYELIQSKIDAAKTPTEVVAELERS